MTCEEKCNGECGDVCPVIQRKRHDIDEYTKKLRHIIATAIPFKNKEDEQKIKFAIWDDDKINPPPCKDFEDWEMESLKPYDVPEEISIGIWKDYPKGQNQYIQFAFIKHEPKEEAESQIKNKLIKDITQKVYGERADVGDSSLSLISDFEVWLINYMEQFSIERIKK